MPSQNLQDAFLNTARKGRNPVIIYLTSGVKLSGRVRGFDKYCVVFETNHQEQLIFKHAISTVVTTSPSRPTSRDQPARQSSAPIEEPVEYSGQPNGQAGVSDQRSPGIPGNPQPVEFGD